MILLHVVIAVLSLVAATAAVVRPRQLLLRASYSLGALTLASGSYVVWATHAPMLQACTTGLVYFCALSASVAVAHRRLASVCVRQR